MSTQQKYALGTQFLEEMNKPAEREKDKKHFSGSQSKEGERTIFHRNQCAEV